MMDGFSLLQLLSNAQNDVQTATGKGVLLTQEGCCSFELDNCYNLTKYTVVERYGAESKTTQRVAKA